MRRFVALRCCSVLLALLGLPTITAGAAGASAPPLVANIPLTGTLVGQAGGALANYPFAGSGDVVTVVLRYTGGNPVIDPGVGFVVFADTNVVVNQTESGGVNGCVSHSFPTTAGTNYGLQVFNYISGFNLDYHLLLSDPGPGWTVSPDLPLGQPLPGGTSEAGVLLRGQSIHQQSPGQGSGTLHNYRFVGDGQPVSLVLNAYPRDPILDRGTGLMVVDQWSNIIQNLPLQESLTPGNALVWTFTPTAGNSYGLQVFNYNPGVLVTYTLTAL